jgi:hypothetical protein
MIMWSELQTIAQTYQQIVQGERPWNALGDFMNYWFSYALDRREELVKEPIQEPAEATAYQHQWAAFCAASVDYLCQTYGVICPDWVHDPCYFLVAPWFEGLGAQKPHVRERLLHEAPEEFAKRNIYCSSRVFANKYELAAQVQKRRSA